MLPHQTFRTLIAAASLLILLPFHNVAAGFQTDPVGRVIVGYESASALGDLLPAIRSLGGKVMDVNTDLGFIVASGFGDSARARTILRSLAEVAYVEDDAKSMRVSLTPSDPYYSTQWAPPVMNADFAWDVTRGEKSVVVAVVDTGIDYNHEDLSGNIWTDAFGNHGYDYVNGDNDPMDDQSQLQNVFGLCEDNPIYHGTHVAGIVGATIDNSRGVAGLAQVSLMAVKVLDHCGIGQISDIASGITYAADNGADIITLSLGGISSTTLRNAVNYAWRKGVVLVAASGNDGGGVSYPAAYPAVVAVGSVSRALTRSTFSNYGSQLALVAPGEEIISTIRVSPFYRTHTGTSQAAPQVAGVAALVLSRNPSLTSSEVREILNSTAIDLGPSGWDNEYGHGLVNAYDAVLAALPGGLNSSVVKVPRMEGFLGSNVQLAATLKSPNGTAIAGRSLDFQVDSVTVGSAVTDSTGVASLAYFVGVVWGQHNLRVAFAGDTSFAASSGTNVLIAKPTDGGNISGVVMDASSYDRLSFSSISLPDGRIDFTTNGQGEFLIPYVPSGTRLVIATHIGYTRTFINVTVASNRTSVVPILLSKPGTGSDDVSTISVVAVLMVVLIVVVTSILVIVVYLSGQRRAASMPGGPTWGQLPPHIAEWLRYAHGLDISRLRQIEVMPVADGVQLAIMDVVTGDMFVVRIDKFGRPVYMQPQSRVF